MNGRGFGMGRGGGLGVHVFHAHFVVIVVFVPLFNSSLICTRELVPLERLKNRMAMRMNSV